MLRAIHSRQPSRYDWWLVSDLFGTHSGSYKSYGLKYKINTIFGISNNFFKWPLRQIGSEQTIINVYNKHSATKYQHVSHLVTMYVWCSVKRSTTRLMLFINKSYSLEGAVRVKQYRRRPSVWVFVKTNTYFRSSTHNQSCGQPYREH